MGSGGRCCGEGEEGTLAVDRETSTASGWLCAVGRGREERRQESEQSETQQVWLQKVSSSENIFQTKHGHMDMCMRDSETERECWCMCVCILVCFNVVKHLHTLMHMMKSSSRGR